MPKGIQYQIIMADREGCPAMPGFTFTDPAEAAQKAKALSRAMGEKLMVKPVVNNKWREREIVRIHNGEYRQLPWAHHAWWTSDTSHAIHKDHFPHPSIERAGWLAYTKSPEDGTRDKQTIVRPGAYLKQYFEKILSNHGASERKLVDLFMEAYGPLDVKFAVTEEEIVSVYETGPDTCMKGKRWPGDRRNPAHVYAAGDLQVAYLGSLSKSSARTLVWPEKKTFSRVYGDIARITRGLERLGYKWGAPIGAKVKKLQVREVKFNPDMGPPTACFIVPYIDKQNQRGGGHLGVIDKGGHLEICPEGTPGSHHCGLAEGYSGQYVPKEDEYPTFTCDSCGTAGFRELHTVFTNTDASEEASWCTKCYRRHAYRCGYSDAMFSTDVEHVNVSDSNWNKYYADMYAVKCEMTGALCAEGNLHLIWFADGTSKQVCPEWTADNGGFFKSNVSGRIYMRDQRVSVKSRGTYSGIYFLGRPELKHHTFQCDGCDEYVLLAERQCPLKDDRLFCLDCTYRIQEQGKTPVSASRKAFDAERKIQHLIAAE